MRKETHQNKILKWKFIILDVGPFWSSLIFETVRAKTNHLQQKGIFSNELKSSYKSD